MGVLQLMCWRDVGRGSRVAGVCRGRNCTVDGGLGRGTGDGMMGTQEGVSGLSRGIYTTRKLRVVAHALV